MKSKIILIYIVMQVFQQKEKEECDNNSKTGFFTYPSIR